MRKIAEIQVAGKTVTVREMTVADVDTHLQQLNGMREPTTLDWLFDETYMGQETLAKIIDCDPEDLLAGENGESLAPSELVPLYEKAVEINPFLAKALARMRKIGEMMTQMGLTDGLEPPPSTS